jgi:hypothetical protein
MTPDPRNETKAIELAWSSFVALIDAGHEEAARNELRDMLPHLHYAPALPCTARVFIHSLALLANNAPAAFEAMRARVLDELSLVPPDEAALLSAMLARDDGSGHERAIRLLVAEADLDLLKAVTGSVPSRSIALLRAIDHEGFLLALGREGRSAACFTAAVALTAIDVAPAKALRRSAAMLPADRHGTEVRGLVAARITRLSMLAAPSIRPSRLKVALCIAGQLRGWRAALATWQPLFQDGHQVSVFLHGWRHLGRPTPRWPQFDLSFAPAFRAALDHGTGLAGEGLLARDYPGIHAWFAADERVPEEALRDAYRTRHVVLEDDRAPPFSAMSPAAKMYDKVERCFDLAASTGEAFDVLVRLRPDKALQSSPLFNWRAVQGLSQRHQAVLADHAPRMHMLGDLIMGDQFACGVPEVMEPYLRTASITHAANQAERLGMPHGFYVHRNFAYACLTAGVRVMDTPDLAFGPLHQAPQIPPTLLLTLLRQDMAARPANEFDAALLLAAEQDAR